MVAELQRAGENVTAMELVRVIYKVIHVPSFLILLFLDAEEPSLFSQDIDKSLWQGAEGNVLHHLSKLLKEGHVGKVILIISPHLYSRAEWQIQSICVTCSHPQYVQRFSGCLTKIRSRNWCMRVSMAY